MESTIYNTYVVMQSQEQCDRMKQLCLDNNLPIWEDDYAFQITTSKKEKSFFNYDETYKEFFIVDLLKDQIICEKTEVTGEEFKSLVV